LPTILQLVIFLGLVWCLASFEALERNGNPEQRRRFILAVSAGLLTGLGMLTRYSFGWVIVPVIVFFAVFGGARRMGLVVVTGLVFAATVSPWIVRNLAVSGTFFGTAGYAVVEGTMGFAGSRLMQSLNPDMLPAYWVMPYLVKLQANLPYILSEDMLKLGGGWMGILFLAGLMLGLRNVVARRLRYFTMMCLGVFLLVSAMGRTQLSAVSPDMNTENPLVLLTPLVIIFGVAFFLTLLNQMNAPLVEVRYAVVGLVVALACQQFVITLLPPKMSPTTYPPYYPPDIQKFSSWMRPDELIMSDIPWAVAWYGHRPCAWTTLNCQYEFNALNDFIKPVNALYLTINILNGKLYSECIQGGTDNWDNFAFKILVYKQLPKNFPLVNHPVEMFSSGLFLSDTKRW
jgi:hypothetical protein